MISYIGGKARIGKWIVPFIPKDIETYVETFSGMFWVFFNMDLKEYPNLKTVVYNDFNGLNANLMKCSSLGLSMESTKRRTREPVPSGQTINFT